MKTFETIETISKIVSLLQALDTPQEPDFLMNFGWFYECSNDLFYYLDTDRGYSYREAAMEELRRASMKLLPGLSVAASVDLAELSGMENETLIEAFMCNFCKHPPTQESHRQYVYAVEALLRKHGTSLKKI